MSPHRNVLIVDDEEPIADLFVDFLSTEGIDPEVAGSGEDALVLMDAHQYELIFCDLRMPGLCGPPLLRQMLQRWPETKIIVMTGAFEEDELAAGIDAGAIALLRKPFKLEEVRDLCRMHLPSGI